VCVGVGVSPRHLRAHERVRTRCTPPKHEQRVRQRSERQRQRERARDSERARATDSECATARERDIEGGGEEGRVSGEGYWGGGWGEREKGKADAQPKLGALDVGACDEAPANILKSHYFMTLCSTCTWAWVLTFEECRQRSLTLRHADILYIYTHTHFALSHTHTLCVRETERQREFVCVVLD
jgi:hypothetical protein